jgi:hypothetical protein
MRNATRMMVVAVAVAALATQGCSKKKEETPPPPMQDQSARPDTTGAGNRPPEPAVAPAQTVAELWPQIEAKQAKLGAAIDENRLKSVGGLAFGLRDLVVVLAERAGVESPDVAPRMPPMLELVKASTARLDELAGAGDLAESRKEFSKLTSILAGMKAATIPKIP